MAIPSTASSRSLSLRLLAVLALVVFGVALSGCTIELALETTVENDGSGTVGIRMAADKEIQDLMASQGEGGDLFADFEGQMPEGWQTDSGTDDDGTRWVTASTSFDDLDEFQSLLQGGEGGPAEAFAGQQVSLTQERGLFTTKTTFQAEWDAGSALSSAGEELPEGVDMTMVSSVFQIQNRLTLPGSIGENNADEVDGNTLVWTPGLTGTTTLSAESTSYNWGLIIGIVVAALVVLVVVVVLIIVLTRRGKTSAPSVPLSGEWPPAGPAGTPMAPGAVAPEALTPEVAAPEVPAPEVPAPEVAAPEAGAPVPEPTVASPPVEGTETGEAEPRG